MKRIAKLIKAGIPFEYDGLVLEVQYPTVEMAVRAALTLYPEGSIDPDIIAGYLCKTRDYILPIEEAMRFDDGFFWYEIQPNFSYCVRGYTYIEHLDDIESMLEQVFLFDSLTDYPSEGRIIWKRKAWLDCPPLEVVITNYSGTLEVFIHANA